MLPLAYFGIESSGLTLVIDLLILFAVVLYLALIYWTYTDARRRILDPMLVGCATAASLFPFVGTIIYMVLRPPEYLEDVRERELETQAIEARLEDLDRGLCPNCDYPIERDFVRCPACLRKLKERCVGCERPLEPDWAVCPYCETDVPGGAPSRRRRRRRETSQDSLLIQSPSPRERSRPEDTAPGLEDGDPTVAQPAATPAGRAAGKGAGSGPAAASEPTSSRARGAARARPNGAPDPRV
jgi:hypothetical protein